jgi:hypothetical protein
MRTGFSFIATVILLERVTPSGNRPGRYTMPSDRPRQTPPELKWVHVDDLNVAGATKPQQTECTVAVDRGP